MDEGALGQALLGVLRLVWGHAVPGARTCWLYFRFCQNFSHVNFTEYQFRLRTVRFGFVVHIVTPTRGFSEYFDFVSLVSVYRYFLSIFIDLCF